MSVRNKRGKRGQPAKPSGKPAKISLLELDEFADGTDEGDESDIRPHGSSKAFFYGRDLGVMVNARPTSKIPFLEDF